MIWAVNFTLFNLYYQSQKESIAKTNCEQREIKNNSCKGKCYLNKKIKQAQKEASEKNELQCQISFCNALLQITNQAEIHFLSNVWNENSNFNLLTGFINSLIKPPGLYFLA